MTRPVDLAFRGRHIEMRGESMGSGPTIVLLHAGGERRTVWRPVAARLAAHGVRAISVDQRGHGDTAGPIGSALHEYADDVAAFVKSLGIRVTLAGCSLGGLAALLATTHPEVEQCLDGLVLIDVIPDPDPARARRHLRTGEQRTKNQCRREPPWSLIEDILARSEELRDAVVALRVPVTSIRGTSSWAIDADDQQRFSVLAPQASLVTIEGSGHLVARDRPEELADALLDHMDRCESTSRVTELTVGPTSPELSGTTAPVLHLLSTLAPSVGSADPASSWTWRRTPHSNARQDPLAITACCDLRRDNPTGSMRNSATTSNQRSKSHVHDH